MKSKQSRARHRRRRRRLRARSELALVHRWVEETIDDDPTQVFAFQHLWLTDRLAFWRAWKKVLKAEKRRVVQYNSDDVLF